MKINYNLLWCLLPLDLMLKDLKLCMLFCVLFISVNKLMLASFIYNDEVYKTDFSQYFSAPFPIYFIKSYLDIGPNCMFFIFSLPLSLL